SGATGEEEGARGRCGGRERRQGSGSGEGTARAAPAPLTCPAPHPTTNPGAWVPVEGGRGPAADSALVADLAPRLFLLTLSLALLLGMSGAMLALAHQRSRSRA